MRHLVFVINPRSGVDRRKAIERAIARTLDLQQYSYEIRHTQYPRHGTELAKEAAANNAYAVVAVGGDGSVNDIARGLLGTETALAIIPKGSGNGMARSLKIPLNDQKAVSVINRGKMIKMDVGQANEHTFISNAGVGFDTVISEAFAKSESRGFKTYSWLVAKHLWRYKAPLWDITIDDKPFSERAFMITVANGQQFGYNFKIAPDASWTDGWLDVIVVKPFPKMLGGTLVWRAMNGSITKSRFVRHFRAKSIIVKKAGLRLMQTDGDAHMTNEKVHFSIRPGALNVLVP